jgi:hypothetical protein
MPKTVGILVALLGWGHSQIKRLRTRRRKWVSCASCPFNETPALPFGSFSLGIKFPGLFVSVYFSTIFGDDITKTWGKQESRKKLKIYKRRLEGNKNPELFKFYVRTMPKRHKHDHHLWIHQKKIGAPNRCHIFLKWRVSLKTSIPGTLKFFVLIFHECVSRLCRNMQASPK